MPASACRETARLAPDPMRSNGVRDREPCLKNQRIFPHRASCRAGPAGSRRARPGAPVPTAGQIVFLLGPHRIVLDEVRRHGGRRRHGQLPAGFFHGLDGTAARRRRPLGLPNRQAANCFPAGLPMPHAFLFGIIGQQTPRNEQHVQSPGEIGHRLGQLPGDRLQPLAEDRIVDGIVGHKIHEMWPVFGQQSHEIGGVHPLDDRRQGGTFSGILVAGSKASTKAALCFGGHFPIERFQRTRPQLQQHLRQERGPCRLAGLQGLVPQTFAARRKMFLGDHLANQHRDFVFGGNLLQPQQLGNPLFGQGAEQELHGGPGLRHGSAIGGQFQQQQVIRPARDSIELRLLTGQGGQHTAGHPPPQIGLRQGITAQSSGKGVLPPFSNSTGRAWSTAAKQPEIGTAANSGCTGVFPELVHSGPTRPRPGGQPFGPRTALRHAEIASGGR